VGDFRPKAFSYVNFPLYAVSLRILDTWKWVDHYYHQHFVQEVQLRECLLHRMPVWPFPREKTWHAEWRKSSRQRVVSCLRMGMVLRIILYRHCGGAVTPIIYIYGAFGK
jgi:hypothetical protein